MASSDMILRDAIVIIDTLSPMLSDCRNEQLKARAMAHREHTEAAVADLAKLTDTKVDGMELSDRANNVLFNMSLLDKSSTAYQQCMQIVDDMYVWRISPALLAVIVEACVSSKPHIVYRRRSSLDAFLIGLGVGIVGAYVLSK
jgi:putative heme degradation protein